jgi:hypothetical protein
LVSPDRRAREAIAMSSHEDERRYTEISARLAADPLGASAIRGAEGLNQKAAALLQHVSIMVATSAVFLGAFGFDKDSRPDVILVGEIIVYLLICLVCLRTIWVSSAGSYPRGDDLDPVDRLIAITMRRRRHYRRALFVTIVVTVFFVGNVIYYTLGYPPATWSAITAAIGRLTPAG